MLKLKPIAVILSVLVLVSTAFALASSQPVRQNYMGYAIEANSAAGLRSRVALSKDNESVGTYSVVRVVDGDTIVVDFNGAEVVLRLIGVNTPETVDPRKPVECFGREASAQTKSLLEGAQIRVRVDASQGTWDKYNRLLAYVFRDDGLFINKHLIETGYAYEYTYNTAYEFQKEFDESENHARNNSLGLWAPNACRDFINAQSLVLDTEPIENDHVGYTCTVNTYDCSDFTSQAQAQEAYVACGGAAYDVHKLDGDRDGRACEGLN